MSEYQYDFSKGVAIAGEDLGYPLFSPILPARAIADYDMNERRHLIRTSVTGEAPV